MAETQPTLSFPRDIFAKLSPHPYLLAHLQPIPSQRANGRSPAQCRPPHINNGSLTHAEGSAVVRVGDTTVVCGVRGEILLASDAQNFRAGQSSDSELQDLDLLVPNIELATGCSPAFLPGQPPSTLAQSLSTRLYSLLHSSKLVDAADLRIWHEIEVDGESVREVKAFWTLYIDILFISLDGNPFDTAWAAVLSALRDVRLPHAYWDIDREMILCSDEVSMSKKLTLRGMPIASTYAVFEEKSGKYWVLADPDTFEEGLCDETVTTTVDCGSGKTAVLGISKSGGTMIGKEEMRSIFKLAQSRWQEWYGLLGK